MPTPLTGRLREATRALHVQVERAGVMQQLLRGPIGRPAYCALLRSLHAIYAALEQGLDANAAHPALVALPLAALSRGAALASDLAELHGTGWAEEIATAAAARDYAGHLRTLAQGAPARLAAHAYVRYLGDLNGGQVLARVVAERLHLVPGAAVAFYDFGPAPTVKLLEQRLRAGLDRAAGNEDEARALVDEACEGFRRHRTLFEQLASV